MEYSWIDTSWSATLMVAITTIGIYVSLIILTRIAGLRSFSKMSSFDFAMTVAIGSVIATTILTKNPPLYQGIVALIMLYGVQMSVAKLRRTSKTIDSLVDNQPLLLMDKENILHDNLKEAKMTYDDLRAKLREANITQLSQVQAVVMEATGDVSVLHNEDSNHQLDAVLLKDVRS